MSRNSHVMPFASRIAGIGSAFPETSVSNSALAEKIANYGAETNDPWIVERTGIRERRFSQPGNEAERNSSLGYRAAIKAMEMAGIGPMDIDQIIYATCSPDTLVPSTACWLQSKLGAKRALAYDLNAACSGFVFGLSIADQAIQTGKAKHILLLGSEVLSPFLNWKDRQTCIIFGDGSGAAVISQCPSDSPSRILGHQIESDGTQWDLFYMPAGGSNQEVTAEVIEQSLNKMQMKGRDIFKFATRTLADNALKMVESQGLTLQDVDWMIPHQANLRILEAVAKRLDFPVEKVLVNVDRYANTSAATVPTAMDEAVRDGRIKKGQLLLLNVFGAGVTYGAALVRW